MPSEHTKNWPDLAIGLYDRVTGRNAEIAYEFVDMHVPAEPVPMPNTPNGFSAVR